MGLANAFAAQSVTLRNAKENRRDRYGKVLFDGMVQVMVTMLQAKVKTALSEVGPGKTSDRVSIMSLRKAKEEARNSKDTRDWIAYFDDLKDLCDYGKNQKLLEAKTAIYAEGAKLSEVLLDYCNESLNFDHSYKIVAVDCAVYTTMIKWLEKEEFQVETEYPIGKEAAATLKNVDYHAFSDRLQVSFSWKTAAEKTTPKKRGRKKKTPVALVNKM